MRQNAGDRGTANIDACAGSGGERGVKPLEMRALPLDRRGIGPKLALIGVQRI